MRSLLLAAALASAGCVVVPAHTWYRTPASQGPATAPAPGPRLLSEDEAADVAARFAASRGVAVERVTRVHLDGDGRWHVDLRGRGHAKAKVLVDARTGRVLKARLKDGRKHERDDDDEQGEDD